MIVSFSPRVSQNAKTRPSLPFQIKAPRPPGCGAFYCLWHRFCIYAKWVVSLNHQLRPSPKMTARKENARIKSSADYRMTFSEVGTGRELDSFLGSLSKVCEYLGEHVYTQIEGYFESYHKIRRSLLAAGGAYAACYNRGTARDGSQMAPGLLTIVVDSLVPAPAYQSDESLAHNRPLLPSTQRLMERASDTLRAAQAAARSAVAAPAHAAPLVSAPVPTPLDLPIAAAELSATSAEYVAPVVSRKPILVPLAFRQMTAKQQEIYVTTGTPQFSKKKNLHARECNCLDCRPAGEQGSIIVL